MLHSWVFPEHSCRTRRNRNPGIFQNRVFLSEMLKWHCPTPLHFVSDGRMLSFLVGCSRRALIKRAYKKNDFDEVPMPLFIAVPSNGTHTGAFHFQPVPRARTSPPVGLRFRLRSPLIIQQRPIRVSESDLAFAFIFLNAPLN